MILKIKNLSKKYKNKCVVNNCSLSVAQGEVVALLGPNGAGKTTSFYMITGMIKPDSGKIFLDHLEITHFPIYMKAKIGIGYLAQESSIFRELTVEENILCALEAAEMPKDERKNDIDRLLDYMHIEHIRHRICSVLSGGEKRRVEIARILAIRPNFILLDEPFAGVDPVAIQDIVSLIIKLKAMNIGVIITDHNVKEALKIADKTYVLIDGNIIAEGSEEDIVKNPMVIERYLGKNFTQ